MNQDLQPLAFSTHGQKGWFRPQGFAFIQNQPLVPLVFSELSRCIGQFPLAFLRHQDQVRLVAVVGHQSGHCDYLHPQTQRWLADYAPSWLRAYPFQLRPQTDQPDQLVFCIQSQALAASKDQANALPLFQGDQLHPDVQAALDHLQLHEKHLKATHKAAAALGKAKLLQPWPATIEISGQSHTLTNLYAVNEKKLNALGPQALAELHQEGALALAYAQLYSQAQLKNLQDRAQLWADYRKQNPASPEDINLDEIFGESDTLFKF